MSYCLLCTLADCHVGAPPGMVPERILDTRHVNKYKRTILKEISVKKAITLNCELISFANFYIIRSLICSISKSPLKRFLSVFVVAAAAHGHGQRKAKEAVSHHAADTVG